MKDFIIGFILDLLLCWGAGIMIVYSGITNGMNWLQIICLIFGARIIMWFWDQKQER